MDNPIDINQIPLEELVSLPGVTPELAERIIAARPFGTLEDLQRVKGMNKRLIKKLRTRLTLPEALSVTESMEEAVVSSIGADETTTPEETPPPVEVPLSLREPSHETPIETHGASEEELPAQPPAPAPEVTSPAPEPAAPPLPPRQLNRNDILLYGAAFSLATLFLGLVITLGFLGILNGGLRFVSLTRFAVLQSRVEMLEGEINTLQQDVEALRLRVETMEALGGRVSALEKESGTLRTGLETTASQVNQLQNQIDDLSQRIHDMQKNVQAFERFLQGLRALLADLMPSSP